MRQTNASHAEAQLIPQGAQAPVKVPGASITSILTPPFAKCSKCYNGKIQRVGKFKGDLSKFFLKRKKTSLETGCAKPDKLSLVPKPRKGQSIA